MTRTEEITQRLLALHPKKLDLSLDRLRRLLATMGNPERNLPPVIHVAGTNGKGSTIAFMRSILEAAGKRFMFTLPSPMSLSRAFSVSGKACFV